jgi:hypothetical protein
LQRFGDNSKVSVVILTYTTKGVRMFLNRSFLIATGFSLTIFSFLSCSFECNELLVDGYDNIWVMLDQKNDGKLTDKQQFSNLLEQKIKLWREHTGTVFLHIPKIFEFLDVLEYYTFECYRTHDLTIEKVLKSQIDRRVQKALTLTFEALY